MQRIVAGGIVFFALVTLADTDTFGSLAVAFAYLILLSAALAVGPVAFGRISKLVTTSSGSAGGGGTGTVTHR